MEIPVTAEGEPARVPDAESAVDTAAGDPLDTDRPPAAVAAAVDRPVLLFDGVCNLCNATVRAVVRLDKEGEVLFAPLQSDVGRALLERVGMDPDYFDSVVLVEGEECYTKSAAVLRVCRRLDGPVPLLYPLILVPERLRDGAYDLVGEYRYQVFGRQDECPVPDERTRQRFLDRSLA